MQLRYVHRFLNQRSGRAVLFVEKPEDFLYSSERYDAGLDCMVEVADIGLPWRTVR
jgi:hypothetical protein